MIKDRLKELALSANEQKKAEHLRQIERRLQKSRQRTKWQVGVISALVCILVLFLIGTGEVAIPNPQTSAGTSITKAYIISGEGNPYSALQKSVNKVDEEKWTRFMAKVTEGMKPVDSRQFGWEANYTICLNYQDGPQIVYEVYMVDESIYFEQKETGQLYELQETFENFYSKAIEPLYKNIALPYILALMVLALIIAFFAERKWNKKDEHGRKPPKHSHSSQSIVEIIMACLVIILIVFMKNTHFFVPAGIVLAATAMNCFIESRKGKSRDRQLMLIMNSLQYLTALAIIYCY